MGRVVRKKPVNTYRLADADVSDQALINHFCDMALDEPIHSNPPTGKTPKLLHEHGIYVCDNCQHIQPLEYFNCRKCGEQKMIKTNDSKN